MGNIRYAKQVDIASEGMFYRFVKKGDTFIHTAIGGKLLYEFGFTPDMIIGKNLFEFFPEDYAKLKHELYVKAWEGHFIQYESRVKGIYYVACLRPIFEDGKVIEVEASCIDVTDRINSNRQPVHSSTLVHQSGDYGIAPLDSTDHLRKNIIIRENRNIVFVPKIDIIFIERLNRKSIIHTVNRLYATNHSLTSLLEQLDDRFFRSHKSFILNIDYLEIIEQKGKTFIGHFRNYSGKAKISNSMVEMLKQHKLY